MLIVNKLMILTSLILLVLCMLAPLKKSRTFRGNKTMQAVLKPHMVYGILLLITSLAHGILAGKNPGMMSGKLAWCCLVFLLIFSGLKGRMKTKYWLFLHRAFSILLCVLIVVHILHAI